MRAALVQRLLFRVEQIGSDGVHVHFRVRTTWIGRCVIGAARVLRWLQHR